MEQQSLFFDFGEPAPERKSAFPEEYHSYVKEALQDGITSAKELSEMLVGNFDSLLNKRYSSGKLQFYPQLCQYLDDLAKSGFCTLMEKSNTDRTYHCSSSVKE